MNSSRSEEFGIVARASYRSCLSHFWCFAPILFLCLDLPGMVNSCEQRKEKTAYGNPKIYSYPREDPFWSTRNEYRNYPESCEVLFKSFFKSDLVKLVFNEVSLDPPKMSGDYSTCGDKIVVYDGNNTEEAPVLSTICGNRIPTVQSTGRALLLVYTADEYLSGIRYSYNVTYQRIDKKIPIDSSFKLEGTKLITTIVIPCAVVALCLLRCAYARCKSIQYEYDREDPVLRDENVRPATIQVLMSDVNDDVDGDVNNGVSQQAGGDSDRVSPYHFPLGSRNGTAAEHDPGLLTADHQLDSEPRVRVPESSVSPSAPSYDEVVQPEENVSAPPPPSYAEALSGSYEVRSV